MKFVFWGGGLGGCLGGISSFWCGKSTETGKLGSPGLEKKSQILLRQPTYSLDTIPHPGPPKHEIRHFRTPPKRETPQICTSFGENPLFPPNSPPLLTYPIPGHPISRLFLTFFQIWGGPKWAIFLHCGLTPSLEACFSHFPRFPDFGIFLPFSRVWGGAKLGGPKVGFWWFSRI